MSWGSRRGITSHPDWEGLRGSQRVGPDPGIQPGGSDPLRTSLPILRLWGWEFHGSPTSGTCTVALPYTHFAERAEGGIRVSRRRLTRLDYPPLVLRRDSLLVLWVDNRKFFVTPPHARNCPDSVRSEGGVQGGSTLWQGSEGCAPSFQRAGGWGSETSALSGLRWPRRPHQV